MFGPAREDRPVVRREGANCPDAGNFMFPFSLRGVTREQVSDGQSFVLRRSPFSQR